ncbi:monovalent cation/H(+) antiporter subunit G [Nocardioides campestrisoli]|uniref:monovalent cation/H(+) antiporter subunit G n=1 Tax=Nocardioides campestrisoli TaxID=2736757 RepID=UPI0015E683F4|nr:monovalent cation/H(+) antiporter subunit G [Nocardioides campestrisoli]
MSIESVLDVLSAVSLLVGAGFALIAAIGVVRLPDLPSRMHAATKPQVIGLGFVVLGLGLRLREPSVLGLLALVVILQMATSVVSSHMVGRASFRAGQVREDLLVVDELSESSHDWEKGRGAP